MKFQGQKEVEITNAYLRKLCGKSLIWVGLGKMFDSILMAILCRVGA
jgi:hypothetical protein